MSSALFIEGPPDLELDFNLRDFLGEECGVFGAFNIPNASLITYLGLNRLQHRGDASCGMTTSNNGDLITKTFKGKIEPNFGNGYDLEGKLPGNMAVGHTRYATRGGSGNPRNFQPFEVRTRYGQLVIAHNGTFINSEQMSQRLEQKGHPFSSDSDTELFAHLISESNSHTLEGAIESAAMQIPTAFSILVMTPDKLIAIKDKHAIRPLSIASMEGGYLLSSENFAFRRFPQAEFVDEVKPGEIVIFEEGNQDFQRIRYADGQDNPCAFEWIYFSNPRSSYNGVLHEDFRYQLGVRLFEDNPDLSGGIVVPILDSGMWAAKGFADASGMDYTLAFQRDHNGDSGRSFIQPTDIEREEMVRSKLDLRGDLVRGRDVYTVDDSMVRGNTMRIINKWLKDEGAKRTFNVISSPPIVDICPSGMAFGTHKELIAHSKPIPEIEADIGSDGLIYQLSDGVIDVRDRTYKCGSCTGCFKGGSYPVDYKQYRIEVQ